MAKETPLVSIISVNFNGMEDTCQMIDSIIKQVTIDYEIIIVDNGSEKDEAEMIRLKYPQVRVFRSQKNLGFAGGNNLGIDLARGKYFFFLNNDTLIKDDTLGYLIQRLESSAKAGGAGPKIRFAWEPYPIQFAGYTELSDITLRNELVGFMQPDDGEYDIAHITPYIHGAAFMLKREAVEIAGKMPEVFFLYYEELDWSERIRECGYELWYEPKTVVYHKESRSTGAESPLKVFYMTRNRLLYAVRNRKKGTAVLSVLYQLIFAVPKQIFMWIWKGKLVLAGAALKGVKDFFKL